MTKVWRLLPNFEMRSKISNVESICTFESENSIHMRCMEGRPIAEFESLEGNFLPHFEHI